jgi:cytochrome c peroxidase
LRNVAERAPYIEAGQFKTLDIELAWDGTKQVHISIAQFTFIGEVLLSFWLLWRGVKGFENAQRTAGNRTGMVESA